MEINLVEARKFICEKFHNHGDFDFICDEDMNAIIETLLELDIAYINEIEDDVYDEEVIYERMFKKISSEFKKYQTYLMRLVDDYMDFMEQYLVSIDAMEWE